LRSVTLSEITLLITLKPPARVYTEDYSQVTWTALNMHTDFRGDSQMKLIIRISALTIVLAAAFAENSAPKTATVAAMTPSSVPGGGGPMPTCNPFKQTCPPIR
jgi:hypothetical protein